MFVGQQLQRIAPLPFHLFALGTAMLRRRTSSGTALCMAPLQEHGPSSCSFVRLSWRHRKTTAGRHAWLQSCPLRLGLRLWSPEITSGSLPPKNLPASFPFPHGFLLLTADSSAPGRRPNSESKQETTEGETARGDGARRRDGQSLGRSSFCFCQLGPHREDTNTLVVRLDRGPFDRHLVKCDSISSPAR